MVGLIIAGGCWAVWFLSPERIEWLSLSRHAVDAGEWWRLWTATLTTSGSGQLLVESTVIAMMGLILHQYVRSGHLLLAIVAAVPVMNWLLIHFEPGLEHYRGATALAAMLWMLGVWFLLVECKRFSFPYLLGMLLLLIGGLRIAFETWLLYFSHRAVPDEYRIFWDMDLCGALFGLALFNGLHQIYKGRIENRARPQLDQYGKPIPTALNRHQGSVSRQPGGNPRRMPSRPPGSSPHRMPPRQRRR